MQHQKVKLKASSFSKQSVNTQNKQIQQKSTQIQQSLSITAHLLTDCLMPDQ